MHLTVALLRYERGTYTCVHFEVYTTMATVLVGTSKTTGECEAKAVVALLCFRFDGYMVI